MFQLDSFVFYVADMTTSEQFYSALFDCEGQRLSPTFLSYQLTDQVCLQLKTVASANPPANVLGGGGELSLHVASHQELDNLYQHWSALGATVLQSPQQLIFGVTFVIEDPDRHRIRVWTE